MDVHAGDQVILYRGTVSLPQLSTVKRVTPSGQIVLEDYPVRFYPDGREVGGLRHSSTCVQEATPDNLAKMEQERQRRQQNFYMQQLRTALQMYTQNLDMAQIESLLQQLGVPLPDKILS